MKTRVLCALAVVAALLPGPAAAATASDYIVVLRQSTKDVAAAAHGIAGHGVRKVFDRALRGFTAGLAARDAARLARHPEVALIVPDAVVRVAGVQPGPPSWGLDRIDQRYLPLDNSYTFPDAAVPATVVVIDSGIRVGHTDFGGRAQHLFDFVDGDTFADDCHGHGTAVAGVIGGTAHGVAKEVTLQAIRVADCAGDAPMSRIIEGLNLVPGLPVTKPALVNLSLGFGCTPMPSCAQPLHQAIQGVIQSGYPVVVAAGNANQNACAAPIASVTQAITVGATQQDDTRRADSNFGTCVDLWAPGDAVTVGHTSDTATTAAFAGTSIAAAHVSGVAAMVMSTGEEKTPARVALELNGMTTTRVVGGIAGTDSPNKLVSTSSAPLAGDRWAYVWADQPASASYTPSTWYQANSTGALNTITRVSAGTYTVRFANVGTSDFTGGGGGTVNVSAYSGSHLCKVVNWATGVHVDASVRCFLRTGVPADAYFTASYTGTRNSPHDFGFVWNSDASNPSPHTPSLAYQFNSMGRTNTVWRVTQGRYSVRMPGLGGGAVGGSVLVTAYGGGPTVCITSDWFSDGADLTVDVQCRTTSGNHIDSMFTVTYARHLPVLGVPTATGANVYANNPFAASYTPSMAHQFNSSGAVNTVTRHSTGSYTAILPGVGTENGHVQVTAAGWGQERCSVSYWYTVGADLHAAVSCVGAAGAALDSRFTLSYTR